MGIFLVGGLNWLTRIFFVLPLTLIAIAGVWVMLFSDGSGAKHKVVGDCSIAGVANGHEFEIRSRGRDGKEELSTGCHREFLPGHYVEQGKQCVAQGEKGELKDIHKPGEWGLNVPKIQVCTVVRFTRLK